jgi:predicted Zn-dependent protease
VLWNWRLAALLFFIGGAGTTAIVGDRDHAIGLGSVLEVWGDVLRDADTLGLRLTRVSDQREVELGTALNAAMFGRMDPNSEWDAYVAEVGRSIVPYVNRRDIPYEFRVVNSPILNAFALPGGRVYITTGLLKILQNEAELAAILGHEMSHVDLRHCVERYQYQLALERIGMADLGDVADFTHLLVRTGYGRYQEVEADANGIRLSAAAGYDPGAAGQVFRRMQQNRPSETAQRARTPFGEAQDALIRALGDYFASHPPSDDRGTRLDAMIQNNRSQLRGRRVYVGVENYRRRIARSLLDLDAETHAL